MSSILMKGIILNGRVEVAEPINLPDGSEVTISGNAQVCTPDDECPMIPSEVAERLAAMDKVEPFDMTNEERTDADAWEKKVNDYTIANLDRGLEDAFP